MSTRSLSIPCMTNCNGLTLFIRFQNPPSLTHAKGQPVVSNGRASSMRLRSWGMRSSSAAVNTSHTMDRDSSSLIPFLQQALLSRWALLVLSMISYIAFTNVCTCLTQQNFNIHITVSYEQEKTCLVWKTSYQRLHIF